MRLVLRVLLVGRRTGFRARIRKKLGIFTWLDRSRRDRERQQATAADAPTSGAFIAPDGFAAVIRRDQLVPGEVAEAFIGSQAIAIANVDGVFHAVSNVCPHAGGPLGDGSIEGATLTCPYHGWSFDVTDGRCFVNEEMDVEVYEVRVIDQHVCVRRPGEQ